MGLLGEREDRLDAAADQAERLRPGVQLDAARARRQAALRLGQRDRPSGSSRQKGMNRPSLSAAHAQHAVVGHAVAGDALGIVQREDQRVSAAAASSSSTRPAGSSDMPSSSRPRCVCASTTSDSAGRSRASSTGTAPASGRAVRSPDACLERRRQRLADLGRGDPLEHRLEEAADDQPLGLASARARGSSGRRPAACRAGRSSRRACSARRWPRSRGRGSSRRARRARAAGCGSPGRRRCAGRPCRPGSRRARPARAESASTPLKNRSEVVSGAACSWVVS